MKHTVTALTLFLGLLALGQSSPHGELAITCEQCHTTQDWINLQDPPAFDHQQTSFKLMAAHRQASCKACHQSLVFEEAEPQCASCHTDIHQARFGEDCESCHVDTVWEVRMNMIQRHQQTLFPLLGEHARLDCEACHDQQTRHEFSFTSNDCQACHLSDFDLTTNPNHVLAGFSTDCVPCHDVTAADWAPARFQHPASFPLVQGHAVQDCQACHENGFQGTPTDCVSCHLTDYQATVNPNHATNQFSTDCQACHTISAWSPATFDHNQTQFPLAGAHVPLDCLDCHSQGYTNTPTDCIACHQTDYDQVPDPNHVASQFSTDCTLCHTTNAWSPATFDHNQTQFPLAGAHAPLDCLDCHSEGYTNTPTDCIACHQTDYDQVPDPNHVASQFSMDCTLCHTINAWSPATFDHNQTQFPLAGAHAPLDCLDCHSQGYTNTPTDCIACHQTDYDQVPDPNHVSNQFSTDCTLCHTTNAWSPATFDHNQTQFPLAGAHAPLDCLDCHSQGYSNTPTDCLACHQTDYNQVPDPNHVSNQFSTDCTLCHSTNAWSPATFDHNQTQFPLAGAHAPLDCLDCHSQGYANTPTDCVACHQIDYTNAIDPNHLAAQFPTTCEDCHNTADWNDANFNHMFPIYSGQHRNEWDTCADCHVNPNNFEQFSCIDCHAHPRSDMDDEHDEVNGYVYESMACYACHPNGEEDER